MYTYALRVQSANSEADAPHALHTQCIHVHTRRCLARDIYIYIEEGKAHVHVAMLLQFGHSHTLCIHRVHHVSVLVGYSEPY